MPIAPNLRHHYAGAQWEATQARILDRAQHCCERCGVPNHLEVRRCRGWWLDDATLTWIAPGKPPVDQRPPAERGVRQTDLYRVLEHAVTNESRLVKIVLCVCHLNHTPGDDRDVNLAAWCQFCHLDYDMSHHAETRKVRKDARRPLLAFARAMIPRHPKPETSRAIREHSNASHAMFKRLVDYCKHLEPTLRDLNANNAADRLTALLGEIEAVDATLQAAIMADPEGALADILGRFEHDAKR